MPVMNVVNSEEVVVAVVMAAVEAAEHLAEAAEAAAVESVAIAVVVALNHNNLWFLPHHLFENVTSIED